MTIWFLKVCFKIKSAPIKFVASSTIVNHTAYIGTLAISNCNINQMILVTNYDIITKNLYWRYTTDEEGWGEVCPTIGSKYYDCTFMSHHITLKGFIFIWMTDRIVLINIGLIVCIIHVFHF